ncbi:ABC transporter permease [Mycoplasmopsis felifaucium]|uniref:ABC transporter permease n=1 Tax=Mycoplasmopsis felifaucium TaxID=35768 RepID=A0ABZ2RXJ3_9BACT
MWRLFKEVFKSLTKNKVMVIGLAILIFLTSAVFTLLSALRSTIVTGFNNYKQVSKMHDIVVDLNLPTQGSAYNQGYFVNGQVIGKDGVEKYTPIEYYVKNPTDEYKPVSENIFYLPSNEYISLDNFRYQNGQELINNSAHKFIKKSDLEVFYSIYKANNNNSWVEFNLGKNENDLINASFQFLDHERNFQIYDSEFQKIISPLTLANNTILSFDKQYSVGDLMVVKSDIDGADSVLVEQVVPLFINLKTKEITIDYSKGNLWIDQGIGYLIPAEIWLKAFEFSPLGDNKFVFKQLNTNENLSKFIVYPDDSYVSLNENLKIKKQWLLSDFYDNNLKTDEKLKLTIQPNHPILINRNLLAKNTSGITFQRWNYYTTYIGDSKSMWSGAFATFMNELQESAIDISKPDHESALKTWNNLQNFSYWRKYKTTKITKYIDNLETTSNILVPIDEKDLTVKLFTSKTENRTNYPSGQIYNLPETNALLIKNIDSYIQSLGLTQAQQLEMLNNANIKNDKYNMIKLNAYDVTKNIIISKVKDLVHEDNIGLRKTITVDAINEKTKKQNVFHFINTGDENNIVDGVKLNVGKLYNEQKQSSPLSKLTDNSNDSIYNQNQIPPTIASMLIQSIGRNLYPNPNYIQPVYVFDNVYKINVENGSAEKSQAKIVLLNHYFVKSGKQKSESELENEYKSLNLGLMFYGNNYKLVSLVDYNGSLVWQTNSIASKEDYFDKGILTRFLEKNNLTIATHYIRTEGSGWVAKDPQFSNINYVPLEFLSPKADLINEILKHGKVDYLAESIEKYILNSDLVKDNFISPDQVIYLANALKVALNNNNFANVFSSSKINTNILPKLIFDLLYELTHNDSGDVFENILISLFERVKAKIISSGTTLETQKEYLVSEVNNIFEFIKSLSNIDLSKYVSASDLVNLSINPIAFIDAIENIFISIDYRKFSDLARNWYNASAGKLEFYENDQHINRLSTGSIINWLFQSIDQSTLKTGLKQLIQNIDFDKQLDLSSHHSILLKIIDAFVPWLANDLNKILNKIKVNGNYDTFKKGLTNIIQNIDFNIVSSYINQHISKEYIQYEKTVFDLETNKNKVLTEKIAIDVLKPSDGMMALMYGLFYNPGTNKEFKNNLVKMLNLSSKVIEKTITLNGYETTIIIPANDDEKLGLFDFLDIFQNSLKSTASTGFVNFDIEKDVKQLEEIVAKLAGFKEDKLNYLILEAYQLDLLNKYNLINSKTWTELLNSVKGIKFIIGQSKGATNKLVPDTQKTAADYLLDLYDFDSGNTVWKLIKNVLSSASSINITNEYALGAQAFSLYNPWINLANDEDSLTKNETVEMLNNLINLAIDPEAETSLNKLSTGENIPFATSTGFGLTNAINNPELINIFDVDSQNNFTNNAVKQSFNTNENVKKIILKNKIAIIKLLGLIASSKKYSSNSQYENGIYYHVIHNFIDNVISDDLFWNAREIIANVVKRFDIPFPIQLFGISEIIINPVLRTAFPQLLMSYVVSEKDTLGKENGNLANIIYNKLGNFEEIIRVHEASFKNVFQNLWSNNDTSKIPLDFSEENTLVLDGAKIWTLFTNNKTNKKIFGLDLVNLINDVIGSIVEPKEMKDIVFNNAQSYIVKVNYAYLAQNNKSIYNGELPNDNIAIESLINKLDDKYLLDVNGIKFIIVGEDTTIDYIYPVIDENNLQVNTSNQVLVYVNDSGFSRIVAAYQGNVVKKSLLVKNGSKLSNKRLQNEIIKIVDSSISDSNKLQRVFAFDEMDPVNPERAIRITTIQGIINTVSVSTITLMTIFIVLVSVSIIFIIKRYIANKAKVLGILVAQGYKPIEIALSMTVFAMVTAIIGGVLGYTIGNRVQLYLQNIFSSYWTLPKVAVPFDFTSLFMTVFVPFIAMSLLIIIVSLIELKRKPNELITESFSIPTGKAYYKLSKIYKKSNIKNKFSFALRYTGFWKLMSFSASVLLTSVATMFGVANIKTFSNTINKTYQNRNYKFKIDLESPTAEGGYYSLYNVDNLNNLIYTPIGELSEGNRESADYFKPGYSNIINVNNLNGYPVPNSPHVLTQFSVNVTVDAGVSADPWLVAYNGMPDSQKTKIDKLRDQVGYELEWSQNLNDDGTYKTDGFILKVDANGVMSYENKEGQKSSFFKYYKSPYDKQGGFKYALWDSRNNEYVMTAIKTGTEVRNLYRQFIVEGYKKINFVVQSHETAILNKEPIVNPIQNWTENINPSNYWLEDKSKLDQPWVNDYFISFGGVLYNPKYDQTYTYLSAARSSENFKIYGYQKPIDPDKAFVKLIDENGKDLYDKLYSYNSNNSGYYPLVINEVSRKKYNWEVGTKIAFDINNRVDRYKHIIKEKIYANDPAYLSEFNEQFNKNKHVIFEVVGINPTYINNELITTKIAADKIIGFDEKNLFNGIITQKDVPAQVTDSTSLYSISGYWSGYDGFDLSTLDKGTIEKMFDEIFDVRTGVLATQTKLTPDEIAKFIDPNVSNYSDEFYKAAKLAAKDHIANFSNIYNNKLYVALGTSIDSKDIEVGFTKQIGDTVEKLSLSVIIVCFAISLIILVIMATIMISENEKNIAIWSILGYTTKEKIKMFFGTFIPFLLLALVVAIPIVMLMIYAFNFFLLSTSAIALSLSLSWWHILITTILMFSIFGITSIAVWNSISKMKPVDLLKGK